MVGPASGDLLIPKTIEKWNWLLYNTIRNRMVIFDVGIFDSQKPG
jgi:hypothetical protein